MSLSRSEDQLLVTVMVNSLSLKTRGSRALNARIVNLAILVAGIPFTKEEADPTVA